jgi:uncharacterized membrane protein
VESVERQGDGKVVWHENIWGFRRDWTAEIVDESEPKRVAWRSTSRGGNSGVITFHPLSDRLTRVELNMDFQPQGLFEKLSSGLRFHRRAAKSDLKRFKAYVETRDAMGEQQVEGDEPDQATGSGNGRAQRTPSPEELEEARKEREERRKEREQSRSS